MTLCYGTSKVSKKPRDNFTTELVSSPECVFVRKIGLENPVGGNQYFFSVVFHGFRAFGQKTIIYHERKFGANKPIDVLDFLNLQTAPFLLCE